MYVRLKKPFGLDRQSDRHAIWRAVTILFLMRTTNGGRNDVVNNKLLVVK